MKRVVIIFLLLSLTLALFSCGGEDRGAAELLSDFANGYGIYGTLYSPEIEEGERGYIDADFFEALYGSAADFESDYAVFLSTSLDTASEAGVFVCRDETSRLYAEELCRARLRLLAKMGYGDSAVFIRRRDTVFYSTLPDAERAEELWRDIKL